MGFWDFLKPKRTPDPRGKARVMRMQKHARAQGWYQGPADGVKTKIWADAVIDFKGRHGLRKRYGHSGNPDEIGPITEEYIVHGAPKKKAVPSHNEPAWIKIAKSKIGLREIKGRLHNDEILTMWKVIGTAWFNNDETPWCAAFVNFCLKKSGLPIPAPKYAARARGYRENFNDRVELPGPAYGCIVVFWRKTRSSSSGHVGFVVGQDQMGRLMVLGGNQGDMVTISPYHTDKTNPSENRVLGYYWPKGVKVSKRKLPTLDGSTLRELNNEA